MGRSVRLEVYVERGCFACARAERLADGVRQEFPDVAVAVIDMAGAGGEHRKLVVAPPTFVLNGHVFSLGNPARADLHEAIARLLREVDP